MFMNPMIERLESIVSRYNELGELLLKPETLSDNRLMAKYAKEQASLTQVVETYAEYKKVNEELEAAHELLMEKDEEMKEMAKMEIEELEPKKEELHQKLEILLIPKDPMDENNAIVEIRGAAGGDEGNIFAGDLYRMYSRYAETVGWKIEVMEESPAEAGGFSLISFMVKGQHAYGALKFESGSHRVQRVPKTESAGRIHTSTATVLVSPEVEEADFEIDPNDLEIETCRSSGAGGQHINKTDSAVRIVHKPTGITATCQAGRSQHENREQAMLILKSRLYQLQIEEQEAKLASIKGEQKRIEWGSQIRSYVFQPYRMVKDLRTGYEAGNVQAVMDGDLDGFIFAYLKSQIE